MKFFNQDYCRLLHRLRRRQSRRRRRNGSDGGRHTVEILQCAAQKPLYFEEKAQGHYSLCFKNHCERSSTNLLLNAAMLDMQFLLGLQTHK